MFYRDNAKGNGCYPLKVNKEKSKLHNETTDFRCWITYLISFSFLFALCAHSALPNLNLLQSFFDSNQRTPYTLCQSCQGWNSWMSDYQAHALFLPFVPSLIGLLPICSPFGGSSVGELRVLASEETLLVAPLWQVSIDAIDFKLKWGVGWSIIKSALWTQLWCDAWASLPRLSQWCSVIRAALLLFSPAVLPLWPLLNPPILHLMEKTLFLLPDYTPRTTTCTMLQFLLCSVMQLEVHYRICWLDMGVYYYCSSQAQHPHQRANVM